MARKAIHKSTINHAKRLYLLNEFTLEFIGEVVGVTASTVAAWRDECEWDKERKLETDLRAKYLKALNFQADEVLKQMEDPSYKPRTLLPPVIEGKYLSHVKAKESSFEDEVRFVTGFMEFLVTTDLKLANDLRPVGTAYLMKQEKLLRR